MKENSNHNNEKPTATSKPMQVSNWPRRWPWHKLQG